MSTEQVFLALAWAIVLGAFALLAWALLRDRRGRRTRRRCPKCLYDMRGVPGLTCPECGNAARAEHALKRSRPRVRWALASAGLLVGAWFVAHTPAIRARGWVAAVPTEALVRWAPRDDAMTRMSVAWNKEILHRDFNKRISDRRLAILLDRRVATHPEDWSGMIRTRSRWPAGVPLWIEVRAPRWMQEQSRMRDVHVTPPGGERITRWIGPLFMEISLGWENWYDSGHEIELPAGTVNPSFLIEVEPLVFDAKHSWKTTPAGVIWRRAKEVRVEIGGDVDDILNGVESDDIQAWFEREAPAELHLYPFGTDEYLSDSEARLDFVALTELESMLEAIGPATLALSIEVIRDGEAVAVSEAWWSAQDRVDPHTVHEDCVGLWSTRVRLRVLHDNAFSPGVADSDWRVRLQSNPIMALRNFDSDAYWRGDVEIPLTMVVLWEREREIAGQTVPERAEQWFNIERIAALREHRGEDRDLYDDYLYEVHEPPSPEGPD